MRCRSERMPPRRRVTKSPPPPPRGVLWTPEEEDLLRDTIRSLPTFNKSGAQESNFFPTKAEWLAVARTMEAAHAMHNKSSVARREYSQSRGVESYMLTWNTMQRRRRLSKQRAGSQVGSASTSAQAAGHATPELLQNAGACRIAWAAAVVIVAACSLQLPQPTLQSSGTRRVIGAYFPSVAARFRLNTDVPAPPSSPSTAKSPAPAMYTPHGQCIAPPRPPPPEDDLDDEILCDCAWTSVAGQSCHETDGKGGFPCWSTCCQKEEKSSTRAGGDTAIDQPATRKVAVV